MGAHPNPKDSMESTWRKDKSTWTYHHHVLNFLDTWHDGNPNAFPVFQKTDSTPYLDQWSVNFWIIYHALWPIGIHALYCHFTGRNLHPISALVLYLVSFQANIVHELKCLKGVAKQTGFLDGDVHARDGVPNVGVEKALSGAHRGITMRVVLAIMLAYRSNQPVSLSWWLPLELTLYSIVLDFWFYTYHRACHEVSNLWKYHRTHHLTKHPNPILSGYADHEQEIIEAAIVPLLTYACLKLLGLPMGFFDWWVCHQYIVFAEAFGHSGLRVYSTTPGPSSFLLKLVGCELIIEDHDLHHRRGWRKSSNYGKQTRLWDRVFGTCGERIESAESNVDWSRAVSLPLI